MAYILFRRRPNAAQSFNNFRISSAIAEKSGGDKEKAEKLLALTYRSSIMAAASATPKKIVPVLPPSDKLWSWNRSFEIACDMAAQWCDDEIPILVPEEANIHIGVDINDLSEPEREQSIMDALENLDFSIGDEDPSVQKDAITELFEHEENKPKWLGNFGGDLDRMIKRDAIDAIVDMADNPEMPVESEEWEQEASDIEDIIASVDRPFSDWLAKTMKARKISSAQLARRANMLSSTIARLSKGIIIVPTKSHICAIGLALGLSREAFDEMLALAGYVLSPSVPRDMIVAYYIDKKVSDVGKVNRTLFVNNIPTLGAHKVMPK